MAHQPAHLWRFAGCELDESRRELRVSGSLVDIEIKPLEVLQQLLLHAGEVVTKAELLDAVWPGTAVVDASLATAISKIRKALGRDDIVVTVPRVGYKVAVPVERTRSAPPAWQALHLTAGQPVPGRESWRLTRQLDVSPSSEVWLAEHPKTGETRIFKFAPDEVRLRSLKREVTLARLLRESLGNRVDFVRVLEWNFTSAPYFVESEYAGPTLAEWAEQQGGLSAVPLATRLALLIQVARATGAAHGLGILHKDLKPGNILVSSGPDETPRITVADFGSASLLEPARLDALGITNLGFTQTATSGTGLTGTLMYLAPEVLAGQSPTPASDVYALGLLLYQMVVGDFRRPLAPGWEADVADPLLREDIIGAASGDPSRRFQTASELADRLEGLERRRAEARTERSARSHARSRLVGFGTAAMLALMVTGAYYYRGAASTPTPRSVAVLPFQHAGTGSDIDFLSMALPDEVATLLSRARSLSVRPFSTTRRYDPASVDAMDAGRQVRANRVVTGQYLRVGEQIQITMEAIDVGTGGVLWRDTLRTPGSSLLATRAQLAIKVQGALAAALGASAVDRPAEPTNETAYDLYLRHAALPTDPAVNADGIRMLEQTVALDPAFTPAWVALSRRYYAEARYAGHDPGGLDRFDAAVERAIALEPDSLAAGAGQVVSRVERGDLLTAYARASDLVRRRPDSADAHFALSYVLRFAGLLEESSAQCEQAFLIDPYMQSGGLRSCAVPFLLRGDYPRALNYLQLDLGSDFTNALTLHMRVREGHTAAAAEMGPPNIPQWPSYDMLLACARHEPPAAIAARAAAVQPSEDGETNYFSAAHLAYCGRRDASLEMLDLAVKAGYCSYPAMDTDPLFAVVRTAPRFTEIRTAAVACQRAFLAGRGRT